MSAEISSIKPTIPGVTPDKPELKFTYSTDAYDSYVKEGFEPPEYFRRPDKYELRFLSAVDLTKGKVKVEITRMFRVRAQDFSSDKKEFKEYLLWESNWYAKNWLDNDLNVTSHMEGKYMQQTKKLVTGVPDNKTGVLKSWYEKGVPRAVHAIPFTKTAVDKLLEGQHPFGPDSINITDKEKVVYYGKIENILGIQNFRCSDYTYEQFVLPEWKKFLELATRPGGPTGRLPWWDYAPEPRYGVQ